MSDTWRPVGSNRLPSDGMRRRRGFTLIEVLLACVLTSILAVVAISVLRMTLVESRKIATSRQLISETWLLREQMAIDIGNARAFRVTKDSMVLGGFMTCDRETGARTMQLSLVTYQMVPRGDQLALERTELPFNTQQTVPTKETVWYGVGGMVAYPKAESVMSEQSTIPELQKIGLQSLAMGMSFRLVDGAGNVLLEIQ